MDDRFASVNGRFTVPSVDAAWLRRAATALRAIPDSNRFSASVELGSDPDISVDYESFEAWNDELEQRIGDAVQVRLESATDRTIWSLTSRVDKRTVQLNAWRAAVASAQTTRDSLVKSLGLSPVKEETEQRTPRQGLRQEFHVGGGGITHTWLTSGLDALAREIDVMSSINGRCRLLSNSSAELLFDDWASWRSAVDVHFEKGDLATLYLWAWARGDETTWECDVQRELVTLQLNRASADDAMTRLTTAMRLEPLSTRPYHVRRYTRVYRLNRWTSAKDFLGALDKSVKLAFPKPPAVAEANVTSGMHTLNREPATNLETFRQLVVDAGGNLSGLYLVLEGSGSRYLGMGLSAQDNQFEMWTSLGRSDWQPIAKALENALDIELKEEQKSDNREKSESWQAVLLKMLATAALASGGTYCTTEGVQLWMSHPQVTITSPPVLNDRSSSPPEGKVHVVWKVETNRWRDPREVHPVPNGTIVVRNAAGKVIVETRNAASGTPISITAGDYDLSVTIDSLRVSHRITMHVKGFVPAHDSKRGASNRSVSTARD